MAANAGGNGGGGSRLASPATLPKCRRARPHWTRLLHLNCGCWVPTRTRWQGAAAWAAGTGSGPRWWVWWTDLAALLVLVRLAMWLKPAPKAFRLVAQGIPLLLGMEGVPVEPFGSQVYLGYLPFHSPMFLLPQVSQNHLLCR